MTCLTYSEAKKLEDKIYDSLMNMPDMGIGEMGEARDEARRIVTEWAEENEIEIEIEEPQFFDHDQQN
jgi:hypothetical protein